ncbi:MAG: TetR/AcrR family transcriptional regulator [Oscillospiraceae bacterium]|nr:TetR/AcrR family transcriptional regulator [Oscillospiraceae bacterium]
MQTKRQDQKIQTRKKILDTTFYLYSTRGFSTPTNIIAKEARLSHGAIFVHFSTRDELQLCVLEQFAKEVGNKLHDLSKIAGSISELLYAHINILEEYESFYKNLISEIKTLPEESRTILLALQSETSLHFGTVIEWEKQHGKIKDIPLHMLLNTWLGLLHYYLQNSELFTPKGSVLKQRKDELVDTFVSLISK